MRLTKKYDDGSYGLEKVDCETEKKLGQLEDIEDELGIDLITLFKALKQGYIYVKSDWNEIYKERIKVFDYDDMSKGWYLECWHGLVGIEVKDYGKTWALTKEELEK